MPELSATEPREPGPQHLLARWPAEVVFESSWIVRLFS